MVIARAVLIASLARRDSVSIGVTARGPCGGNARSLLQLGADELALVFGLNQPFTLRILASTFKDGDPSYAGPLGGVALGLPSYHIFELKDEVPPDVWEREMAFKELEMEEEEIEAICALMREIRER